MISEENTNDLLFENKTTINSKEEFFEIEKIYVNSQKKPYYFLKLFVFFFIIGIVAGVLRDPIEFVICMILFALISVSTLMRSKKQLNASLEKLYSENRALIEGVEKTIVSITAKHQPKAVSIHWNTPTVIYRRS